MHQICGNDYDNYYYVSMVVNDDWRVVRYDKANINLEKEATNTNNSSQTTQPTTIAVCTGLTYEYRNLFYNEFAKNLTLIRS